MDGPYPEEPWHDFWQRHEDCSERKASEVFTDADAQDVDALIDALGDAEADENVIGFKFMTAPDEASSEEMFEELLHAGLPTAIWGRCSQPAIDNADELDKILQGTDRLQALPGTIQKKRAEARKTVNTPDCHIGHHISLLRDNLKLIPPTYRSA
ncbi:MAG: hypothetical protein F6K11_29810 [Leptolyngbya sp. SIO3F4]|nr:hypothetical protein [Leptolyngbya sp. SIO3F4]